MKYTVANSLKCIIYIISGMSIFIFSNQDIVNISNSSFIFALSVVLDNIDSILDIGNKVSPNSTTAIIEKWTYKITFLFGCILCGITLFSMTGTLNIQSSIIEILTVIIGLSYIPLGIKYLLDK